jgi:hypothetical protein
MGVVDPAEAQDAAILPTATPRWCLLHHTVASHRIDPTEEYIKNLDPKSGSQTNLDQLAGQPIKICYKMTKKRPRTKSGFTKKRTLEQKSRKKKKKNTTNRITAGTHSLYFGAEGVTSDPALILCVYEIWSDLTA